MHLAERSGCGCLSISGETRSLPQIPFHPQLSVSSCPPSGGCRTHLVRRLHSRGLRHRVVTPIRTARTVVEQDTLLSLTLDTEEAQQSIRFVDVATEQGKDIVVAEVVRGSAAEEAGVRRGQKLLAVSDPVRETEMWKVNERASFRFVRDAIKMRRWSSIALELTLQPERLRDVDVATQSIDLVDTLLDQTEASSDSNSALSLLPGAGFDVAGGSVKLVGLQMVKDSGKTIGQVLEERYSEALPAISAYQRRRQRRKDYMQQEDQRDDRGFFLTVGAAFLLPAITILAIAYSSGYLDQLQKALY